MSGRSSGNNNGGGGRGSGSSGGVHSIIPAGSRKMVQSLKEIVNCPEPEIYAMLQDCNMDPNEAVNRLLSQDPFHEVKSKREKKKENKDTTESRSRGVISTSNRGGRSGTDRYGGRGGSTQFSSSETGAMHGKPSHKKENGTNSYTNSSSASTTAGNNTSQRLPFLGESVTTENKRSTMGAVDGISSASQPFPGYQSAWLGVPGQVSMADIVKMGTPHGRASSTANPSLYSVNHHHVHGPLSTGSPYNLHSADDHAPKASDINLETRVASAKNVSSDDEWPVIEQPPAAIVPSGLEPPPDSELHPGVSNLPFDDINRHSDFPSEEGSGEDDEAIENLSGALVRPASVSSRNMHEDNSGGASLYDDDSYKNMGPYQTQIHPHEGPEVEDIGVSVASVTANLQQASVQKDWGASPDEDGPSVVIPHHLQVQTADCSHLSFGSFGSAISAAFSAPFVSMPLETSLDEAPADADASSVGPSDARNSEYYGDESLRTASDSNLIHRRGANAGSYDSPSVSQPEGFKHENPEVSHGSQYAFPPSTQGYTFENTQELNVTFSQSQMSSQMQNLAPFSSVMTYTNSLPSALLAANVHPVRESDLSYSPFPMAQSMPAKYGNTVSSIGGSTSTISMPEALKTDGFSATQSTPQTLSGTSVATGPALHQHLAVHPYSQPTLPLGPFANMISYPFLPQSYTYMPSFAGNSTYHQSLGAVLPQYKNSVSVSSLPQSAAIASGYGAFGSSNTVPGNFPMNPSAAPAGTTIGYDDLAGTQYKDNNHLISLQQNENSAMWLHGPGSRTLSTVPGSTYYGFQGQSQQPGGYRQGQQPSQNYGTLGYPNFYHSQTGISLEHQQQNPRDGSLSGSQGQPKQSQQIWQNSY